MDVNQEHSILTLDTNIFKKHNFNFDSIPLKSLFTLKKNGIKVVISDVVYFELIAHLASMLDDIKKETLSVFKKTSYHFYNDPDYFIEAESVLTNIENTKSYALKRIETYLDEIGAEVLKAEEFSRIQEVLNRYFTNSPPFEVGSKKQNEFKDAIALDTLEMYADCHRKKIYTVSDDKGWANYCTQSEWLHHMPLSDALDEMQTITGQYKSFIDNFSSELFDLKSAFHKNVYSRFNEAIIDLFPDIENNSSPYHEVNSARSQIKYFKLIGKKPKILFIDEEECTFSISTKVDIDTELLIDTYDTNPFLIGTPYTFDEDLAPSRSTTQRITSALNIEMIIVLQGNWNNGFNKMNLKEVSYDEAIFSINASALR